MVQLIIKYQHNCYMIGEVDKEPIYSNESFQTFSDFLRDYLSDCDLNSKVTLILDTECGGAGRKSEKY